MAEPLRLTDQWYGFNKIALINLIALAGTAIFFLLARTERLVPRGVQNLAESSVDFIRDGIIMQTIGPDGMRYLPYLVSLFFFILIGNIFEVIPGFHMPANARMAGPAFLALLTWVFFIAVGVKHQGPKYFWNAVAPPGVPKALYILVTPDRDPLDLHRAALLPGRATLRQHARRPHPAGDLQRALHHAVLGHAAGRWSCRSRSPCSSASPASRSWWRSCRPTSSPSSPPSTSVAPMHPEH